MAIVSVDWPVPPGTAAGDRDAAPTPGGADTLSVTSWANPWPGVIATTQLALLPASTVACTGVRETA